MGPAKAGAATSEVLHPDPDDIRDGGVRLESTVHEIALLGVLRRARGRREDRPYTSIAAGSCARSAPECCACTTGRPGR